MMLVHGDNKGAVIPPRVAELQAVFIPVGITAKTTEEDKKAHYDKIAAMTKTLVDAGVRAEADVRENYNAGWKFNDYELRGIPLRIEFGPKDAAGGVVMTARRDTGEKQSIPIAELATGIPALLEKIQADMLTKAKADYDAHRLQLTDWQKFVPTLNAKNVVVIPHCLDGICADLVKDETAAIAKQDQKGEEDKKAPSMGAKCEFFIIIIPSSPPPHSTIMNEWRANFYSFAALCIPFEQPELAAGTKCLRPSCGKDAQKWVQFGRSY